VSTSQAANSCAGAFRSHAVIDALLISTFIPEACSGLGKLK